MNACEKCWADARARSDLNGLSVTENYMALLRERKATPCTPEEQRGPVSAASWKTL